MSERLSVPSSASTACDRCHSRKIKCDRLDPCKNCVAANTVCSRLRRKTKPQKMKPTERIRLLTERMHQLENILHDSPALDEDLPDAPAVPGQALGLSDNINNRPGDAEQEGLSQQTSRNLEGFMSEAGAQASTSQISAQARSTNTTSRSSSKDIRSSSSNAARTGAKPTNIALAIEESSRSISVVQRVALNKILTTLDEFSKAPSRQDWSIGSCCNAEIDKYLYELTPSDIINILATGHIPLSSLHWCNSTLATSPSVETIGMELLNGKVPDESKTLPYKIILNFQAAMLLDRQQKLPDGIHEHVESIKRQKFYDVLSKLDQITFRTLPSLHLLRAQCMGVVIFQLFGNVPEAWSMMVAASRTFVALGCDTFLKDSTNNIPSNAEDEDRETCIAWCYQLDRSMSLLLHRPPLLPKSALPPRLSLNTLDVETKWKAKFVQLSLDLTHIQGLISFVARTTANKLEWKDLEPLHNELSHLWTRLHIWEDESPGTPSGLFIRDVDYLRLKGYATQAILLQLSRDIAKSSLLQRVAVDCARNHFKAFHNLIKDEQRIEMINLSWDLLLYSLSPLCVLAYNIVRTRDAEDLELLEEFGRFISTRIVRKSPDNNPLATRIYNLYKSVVLACRSLISDAPPPTTTAGQPTIPTNHTPHRQNFLNFEHFFGGDGSATGSSSSNTNETNQNRNERIAMNAVAEGSGTQIGYGIEDGSVTEEQFLKLLMYRIKIGWSD